MARPPDPITPPSPETPPDPAGSVLVDIGGDVGAAVVYTPPALVGAEIEIRPAGGTWDGTHTAVWERRAHGAVQAAAVFASLPAGRYQLRIRGESGTEHPTPVVVEGGRVTQVTWKGGGLPGEA